MLAWLLIACVDLDRPIDPDDTTEVVFDVPKGATPRSLADEMVAFGAVESELGWRLVLERVDLTCIKAGKHRISRAMSITELAEALCGVPVPEDVPFTVVEGWRIVDIDAALVAKGWIEPGAYADLATRKDVTLPFPVPSPTLEGYLYPETYLVVPDRFTAQDLIERQLSTFQERFLAPGPDLGGRTLHDVVVLASLLEREEPNPENRKVVAGILWKRLDHGWQLGVDATSHYKLAEWNDRPGLLAALRDASDPYNTRLSHGLPPTAIGSPSKASLEAALAPVASEWWFYLHDSSGVFHGAKDAAGHDANRRAYGVW